MYSGPHQSSSGKRLASRKLTIIFKLGDQLSGGPSAVLDQSCARMSAPISPPPARKSTSTSGAAWDRRTAAGRPVEGDIATSHHIEHGHNASLQPVSVGRRSGLSPPTLRVGRPLARIMAHLAATATRIDTVASLDAVEWICRAPGEAAKLPLCTTLASARS